MKILILAANPRKDLHLDREIRDLRAVIEQSRNQQEFQVEDALAVRVGDLQDLLFRHRPQIVHFCGHGSGQQGLVFEGSDGGEQWVRADALSEMFRLFSEDQKRRQQNLDCVLLNACYSEEQASAIVDHIDYVVGMKQTIQDDAAIAFSKGFYRALGYECSIEQAFEFGKNAIQLEISGSSKVRSAASEVARKAEVVDAIEQTAIPEHLKPILKIRPTLISTQNAPPAQSLPQETRVAIQVEIDRSLEVNVREQYRDKVREFLSDRKISPLEKIRLERLRKDLGLSEAEANRILEEELAPIRKAQDDYEAMLLDLIEAGHYPFDSAMQAELQDVQRELGLSDEEMTAIATPILEAAAEEYQARLAQEQQELERQRQLEAERQRAEANRPKRFEFQVPKVASDGTITYQPGQADYGIEDLGNGVTLEMVSIPGGTFWMGSPKSEKGRGSAEGPQHQVTVPAFWMGKFTVTQAQYKAIIRKNPANFKGDKRPVECISWHDAVKFCDQLSKKTGRPYRLPSEAEWEYACRAGTTTPFYCSETITTDLANYDGNYTYGSGPKGACREQTTEVGSFPPNTFGLYDMHGNVWEWCADHWHENYQGAPTNGSAWITGGDSRYRLLRGGSWSDDPRDCRSAPRNGYAPDYWYNYFGFRVVSPAE